MVIRKWSRVHKYIASSWHKEGDWMKIIYCLDKDDKTKNNVIHKTVTTASEKSESLLVPTENDRRPLDRSLNIHLRLITVSLVYSSRLQHESRNLLTGTISPWLYFVSNELVEQLFLSHKRLIGISCNLRMNLISGL